MNVNIKVKEKMIIMATYSLVEFNKETGVFWEKEINSIEDAAAALKYFCNDPKIGYYEDIDAILIYDFYNHDSDYKANNFVYYYANYCIAVENTPEPLIYRLLFSLQDFLMSHPETSSNSYYIKVVNDDNYRKNNFEIKIDKYDYRQTWYPSLEEFKKTFIEKHPEQININIKRKEYKENQIKEDSKYKTEFEDDYKIVEDLKNLKK